MSEPTTNWGSSFQNSLKRLFSSIVPSSWMTKAEGEDHEDIVDSALCHKHQEADCLNDVDSDDNFTYRTIKKAKRRLGSSGSANSSRRGSQFIEEEDQSRDLLEGKEKVETYQQNSSLTQDSK